MCFELHPIVRRISRPGGVASSLSVFILLNDGGGMIMTLSVSSNSNGTITITCGNDSITIGAPDPPKQVEIPPLWPHSGPAASIIAGKKVKTKVIRVPSGDDLLNAIRKQHDLHIQASEPIIFQFHVQGSEPLSVEKINKALSDLGNPEWMGTQIKLTGLGDE
jgi:hypothetical protein